MKATATNPNMTDSQATVPSEIILVGLLLGTAIAAILFQAGKSTPAIIFLALSLLFTVIAAIRRRNGEPQEKAGM